MIGFVEVETKETKTGINIPQWMVQAFFGLIMAVIGGLVLNSVNQSRNEIRDAISEIRRSQMNTEIRTARIETKLQQDESWKTSVDRRVERLEQERYDDKK